MKASILGVSPTYFAVILKYGPSLVWGCQNYYWAVYCSHIHPKAYSTFITEPLSPLEYRALTLVCLKI